MKIALSGRVVESQLAGCSGPVEFVEMAKRCGHDGVDLRASQVSAETPEADVDRLRAALADGGVDVAMMAAAAPADDTARAAFETVCRHAGKLGCGLLRVGIDARNLADGRRACDVAAEHGLRLVTQMHTNTPTETFGAAADWVANVGRDNYGLIVEPGNHVLVGEAFSVENLRLVADRLWMVSLQSIVVIDGPDEGLPKLSLSDGRRVTYKRVPIQDNPAIDMTAAAAALRDVGYDGWINMLEPFPFTEAADVEPFCRDYASFLRERVAG